MAMRSFPGNVRCSPSFPRFCYRLFTQFQDGPSCARHAEALRRLCRPVRSSAGESNLLVRAKARCMRQRSAVPHAMVHAATGSDGQPGAHACLHRAGNAPHANEPAADRQYAERCKALPANDSTPDRRLRPGGIHFVDQSEQHGQAGIRARYDHSCRRDPNHEHLVCLPLCAMWQRAGGSAEGWNLHHADLVPRSLQQSA